MKDQQWNQTILWKLGLAAVLGAVMFLGGCKTDLTDAEYVERAKEYQDKGELRSSTIELKNALRQNPENLEARWLLGQIYVEMGDGASAEKELHRAIELGMVREGVVVPMAKAFLLQGKQKALLEEILIPPNLPQGAKAELYALRGRAYLAEGKLDQAEAEFQLALASQEDSTAARLGQAHMALARQQWDDARKWITKALEVSPEFAEAWSMMGDLEYVMGNAAEAEEAYSKAIDHRLNNGQDLLKRALIRISLKNYQGMQDDIAALKKIAPAHPRVHYVQGLLHFQQQRFGAAQTAFEEALRSNPDYMAAVFYLGVSHYAQDHLQQAEYYLNRFLNVFPQSDQAGTLLAVLRMRNRDLAGAESLLEPIAERNPDNPVVLNLLGNLYLAQEKTREGIGALQKAVALQPDAAKTRMQLGLGLMMEGESDRGLQELGTAIDLDPQLQQADVLLILSYLRTQQFDRAIEAVKRLQEKQPDSPLPPNLLGGVYLGKGDEAKAQEAFNQALSIAPGDPSSTHNLAMLALRNDDAEKARSLYEEVLKHHSGHLHTLLQLSSLELNQGRVQEAKAWLEQATQANPQALEPRVQLGSYYLLIGQPSQALSIVQEIRELYPNNPALLAVLGEAQLANNQPGNAVETFLKLVQIQPQSAQAHYLLAKAYGGMNDTQKVREELNKALKLDPHHFLAKVAQLRLLIQEDRMEEADALLQELKQAHPQNPEIMAQEGWLALRQNRPQEAVGAFEEAIKRTPNSSSSQLIVSLAQAQWQAGDKDVSIATLEGWLEKNPDDLAVRHRLANLYLALNRQDLAKSSFIKMVEQAPNNVIALNNLAWLLRKDDSIKAIGYAERALELAPNVPGVIDTLGTILLEQGQIGRAVRLLTQASEKAPDDLSIRYHLAQALVRSGDKDRARIILRDLLAERTAFPEQQEAESLLQSLDG